MMKFRGIEPVQTLSGPATTKRLALIREYQMPHAERAPETDHEFLLRLLDTALAGHRRIVEIFDGAVVSGGQLAVIVGISEGILKQ